jgi:protein disulfide isomerase family A protein 3
LLNILIFCASGLGILLCLVVGMAAGQAATILELTDDSFDSKLTPVEIALVLFYLPDCPACMQFMSEFEKAADPLLDHDRPVGLARVDCSEGGAAKATCNKFHVKTFPSLKVVRYSKWYADFGEFKDLTHDLLISLMDDIVENGADDGDFV